MEQAGVPIKEDYMKLGRFSVEEGYEKMKELLTMKDRPTAVFLSNYETALGGVMAVNESEWSCPEDISIFGFDDLIVANAMQPKLWTIVQPMEMLCSKAVELLLGRIQEKKETAPMKLSFGVVIQEGGSIKSLE